MWSVRSVCRCADCKPPARGAGPRARLGRAAAAGEGGRGGAREQKAFYMHKWGAREAPTLASPHIVFQVNRTPRATVVDRLV